MHSSWRVLCSGDVETVRCAGCASLNGEGRGPVALIGLHSLWAVYNITLTFWGRP